MGMSGEDRFMVYLTALGTGFRRGELASLEAGSFDLEGTPPTVTVAAGYSKRRRTDRQPIRKDLADRLRPWLAKKAGGTLFRIPDKSCEMIRKDLAAAEVPYKDSAGGFADFHALRHTFVSRLVRRGASVKAAQELARHSSPLLTLGRYAHLDLQDHTLALDGLPEMQTRREPDHAATPAGTRNGPIGKPQDGAERVQQQVQQTGSISGHSPSPPDTKRGPEDSPDINENAPFPGQKSLKVTACQPLTLMQLAGLEPATFGSVDRCSIQLS